MDIGKDYYAILGVAPGVGEAALKSAWRALAKKFHPDVFAGDASAAEARFKAAGEAYEILSDPERRARYDRARPRPPEAGGDGDRDRVDPDLAAEWNAALAFHPGLEKRRRRLGAYSPGLAVAFQLALLDGDAFDRAEAIERALIESFLARYFGRGRSVRRLAARLIDLGERDLARDLNALIETVGASIDADRIVPLFFADYAQARDAA